MNIKTDISPIKDIISKHIFGYQLRKRYSQAMLEGIFKKQKDTYKGLTVLNSIKLTKNNINDKFLEMDILIELPNKEIICIEMYTRYDISAEIKSFMYISRTFSTALNVGEDYKKNTKPITQINFVKGDKVHDNTNNELIREYYVINANNHHDRIAEDLFKIYIVDVDIPRKIGYDFNDESVRWIAFLGTNTIEEMRYIAKGHEIMEEITDEVERFVSEKWVADGLFHRDKLIKEQAKYEGIEQGIEQRNIEMAKSMLQENLSLETIIKITGLTKEKINSLKD